jgi:hypothetical protein
MTAPVGQTVDKTLSAVASYLTGLAAKKADQAAGEDFADFGEALVGAHLIGRKGVQAGRDHVGCALLVVARRE